MLNLLVAIHTLYLAGTDRALTALTNRSEAGSVTIEQVLWTVAVIGFVAIVVTVIRNFVTTEAAKIN
jgi:hypothetical protein